jgi:hypothetical protein
MNTSIRYRQHRFRGAALAPLGHGVEVDYWHVANVLMILQIGEKHAEND